MPAMAAPVAMGVGNAMDPAVSSDGRWLAYAAGEKSLDIWIRPLSGGEARRVTSGRGDHYQPSLSRDGAWVAFRSDGSGGGLYLLRVSGGKPKLLATGGRAPRFSPTGDRLVYLQEYQLFLTGTSQTKAVRLLENFESVSAAIWSADGERLLVSGCRTNDPTTCDWWVADAKGGDPAPTGAASLFRGSLPGPEAWLASGEVLAIHQDRIWKVALAGDRGKAKGPAQRLTTENVAESGPLAVAGGRVIFNRLAENIDVWMLPLDAGKAAVRGPLTRVTSDPSIDQRPALSADGKRIAWETTLGGNFEVWVKDLGTGAAKAITNGPLREHMPAISRDGSKLVYDTHDGEKVTVLLSPFEGGPPVKVAEENVGQGSFQFTARGDSVLYFHRAPPGTVGLLELSSGRRTVLLRHPKWNLSLADARLSPDGRFIVFPVPYAPHRSRLAIARVSDKVIEDERDWVYVTPTSFNAHQPEWSPDGRYLYFLSDQTGMLGVAALRVSAEGAAESAAKPVLLLHGPRVSINRMRPRDIGLAVAKDKLALGVAEYAGALWSVELP